MPLERTRHLIFSFTQADIWSAILTNKMSEFKSIIAQPGFNLEQRYTSYWSFTPLVYASERQRHDMMNILLDMGANIDEHSNTYRATALFWLCYHYVAGSSTQVAIRILDLNPTTFDLPTIDSPWGLRLTFFFVSP